jgi:hypothetical protein
MIAPPAPEKEKEQKETHNNMHVRFSKQTPYFSIQFTLQMQRTDRSEN